jgi:hypothetical protein
MANAGPQVSHKARHVCSAALSSPAETPCVRTPRGSQAEAEDYLSVGNDSNYDICTTASGLQWHNLQSTEATVALQCSSITAYRLRLQALVNITCSPAAALF